MGSAVGCRLGLAWSLNGVCFPMYGKRRRVQAGFGLVFERRLLPDVWEAPVGCRLGLGWSSNGVCFPMYGKRRWDADGVVVECAGKYKRRMHARKRALQEEFNVSLSPKALAICALDVNLI